MVTDVNGIKISLNEDGYHNPLIYMGRRFFNIPNKLPVTKTELVYCDCKDRNLFYRDKEDNDICYDYDLMIKTNYQ